MEGHGAAPDAEAAARWFTLAAQRDFAPAEYSLGTLYEKGNGVARDTSKARDNYLAAASQGNVRAMHNLAVLYATGVDGKSQPEKAADWFKQAAQYGMTDSQYNLGILYARGAGVEQDLGQSYKWFSVVAAAGDKDAASKRDEIKKGLTADQLKAAEADVAAFQPKARDEAVNTVDIPKEWQGSPAEPVKTSSVDMTRAIRNIQAILIKLGYDPGAPDGVVGTNTTEAIKKFQTDQGLAADGKIDETLIRALLAHKDG
nr:SEL1-like repeat protein [Aurantimonas sp. VKM B-3413]